MHGSALVFMVVFWMLVVGLVVFVFCRMYCPSTTDRFRAERVEFDEPDEVT